MCIQFLTNIEQLLIGILLSSNLCLKSRLIWTNLLKVKISLSPTWTITVSEASGF